MLKRIEAIAGVVAACLLFLLMMVTFIDVMGRNFFNRPLTGASELTEVMLATIVFLMLPSIAVRQEHIGVDLVDMLSRRLLDVLQHLLTAIVGTILFGLISWRLWILGNMALRYADATPSLGIPLAFVIYGMSVFGGLTALCFAALLLRKVNRPVSAEVKSAEMMAETTEPAKPGRYSNYQTTAER